MEVEFGAIRNRSLLEKEPGKGIQPKFSSARQGLLRLYHCYLCGACHCPLTDFDTKLEGPVAVAKAQQCSVPNYREVHIFVRPLYDLPPLKPSLQRYDSSDTGSVWHVDTRPTPQSKSTPFPQLSFAWGAEIASP